MSRRTYVHVRQFPKRKPPEQRAKVLGFIHAELKAGRPFPSPQKISNYMGWISSASATGALDGLVTDGQLVHCGRNELGGRVWEIAP